MDAWKVSCFYNPLCIIPYFSNLSFSTLFQTMCSQTKICYEFAKVLAFVFHISGGEHNSFTILLLILLILNYFFSKCPFFFIPLALCTTHIWTAILLSTVSPENFSWEGRAGSDILLRSILSVTAHHKCV